LEDFINDDNEGAGEALSADFSLETSQTEIYLLPYDFSDNIIPINKVNLDLWSSGPEMSFYHSGDDSQHPQSISNPLATVTPEIAQFQESYILGHGTFHKPDETVAEGHDFSLNLISSNNLENSIQNAAQSTSSSISIYSPDHADAAFITTKPLRKGKTRSAQCLQLTMAARCGA